MPLDYNRYARQNSPPSALSPDSRLPSMSSPSPSLETIPDERDDESISNGPPADRQAEIESHESRNLLTLAVHHIALRVSWIFKTESVIMPAFLDAVAGAAWLRGCLPFLNRFGQSVPALALSEQVRRVSYKKRALFAFNCCMAVPFLTLSAMWLLFDARQALWLPAVFLLLYFLFFAANGLHQMTFGTLQGKLIRPHRRGRLLGVAGICGSIPAIICAWFLLQRWVALPDGGFGYIFLFTGTGFLVAGLIALCVVEPPDGTAENVRSARHIFRDAWGAVKSDCDFRNFCIVGMLFMSAQMLFPHYQALGRGQTGYEPVQLMIWVVAQNAGAGLFSPLAGVIADRFGNRRALRIQIVLALFTPLLALLLTRNGRGIDWYWLTFFLLGIVPTTMKTMMNYTLEICEPQQHAQYLSTVKVCMALPFFLSPVFGLLIDTAGFATVFGVISGLVFLSGVLTLRIPEPRHAIMQEPEELV